VSSRIKPVNRNAPASPWRPPTRRAFVAMLGAAAAALAVRPALAPELDGGEPSVRRRASKTIWIGHC
jgi:hypothetical protein